MATKFRVGRGPWRQYRSRFSLSESDEINLHFGKRDPSSMSFKEAMAGVTEIVMAALEEARRTGRSYVMLIHGSSTSRRGKTTARSQVRNFMRSKDATPLIDRSGCIQYHDVFIARLKLDADRS